MSTKTKSKPMTPKTLVEKKNKHNFKSHKSRITTASGDMTWRTPANLQRALMTFGEQKIGLDPCADASDRYHIAETNYSGPTGNKKDGLQLPWEGHGFVYCNPPYGRDLRLWLGRFAMFTRTINETTRDEIILLVPARTDTQNFHRLILPHATALCFIRGRLYFSDGDSPAAFPSLLVYAGLQPERFRRIFASYGWITDRNGA